MVLIVHNFYKSTLPSGENAVVEREVALMRKHEVPVSTHFLQSDVILANRLLKSYTLFKLTRVGRPLLRSELRRVLSRSSERILHAHNVMPSFSFDIFDIAHELGMKTVLTLHNCRLFASLTHVIGPNGATRAISERDTEQLKRMPPLYSSRLMNRIYTAVIANAWTSGTISKRIDRFICMTHFHQHLLISHGIPREKIAVKPHFIDCNRAISSNVEDYAIFVGRVGPEKGILPLARALSQAKIRLVVVGDGPDAAELRSIPGIQLLGMRPHAEAVDLISKARFLVMNSTCYETFGLVLIEALACGTPCLVPRFAGFQEIISEGRTGASFEFENMDDLASKALALWNSGATMRSACQEEYRSRYTSDVNISIMKQIYDGLLVP